MLAVIVCTHFVGGSQWCEMNDVVLAGREFDIVSARPFETLHMRFLQHLEPQSVVLWLEYVQYNAEHVRTAFISVLFSSK